MTEHEPSGRRPPEILINYTEPRIKPPPLLEVGALAWIRKNLLGSWLDALLTVFAVVFVVGFVAGVVQWIVQEGNWFAIMFSLRTYTIGRDIDLIPRVSAALIFVMFAIGATTAAYTRRLAPVIPALFAIIAAALLFLPSLINMMIVPPPMQLTAGNVGIVSGTATEDPIEQIAFVALEGETISLRTANDASYDEGLQDLSGLVDRATNTLRNAAINTAESTARAQEVLTILQKDVATTEANPKGSQPSSNNLTPARRATLLDELTRLPVTMPEDDPNNANDVFDQIKALDVKINDPLSTDVIRDTAMRGKESLIAKNATVTALPSVSEMYHINEIPVQIAIYDAEGNVLVEPTPLDPQSEITYTIPSTGWYILEKVIPEGQEGVTVVAAQGVFPLFQISDRYVRVVDNFELSVAPPKDVKWIALLENRYRGARPLDEFLRLYVSPFLEKIRETVLKAMLAIVIGFLLARVLDSQLSPLVQPQKESRRLANWLLIATPFVVFLLINGLDMLALMPALSWMISLYWLYHLGTLLYAPFAKRSYLPVPLVRAALLVGVVIIGFILIRFVPTLLYDAAPTTDVIALFLAIPMGLMFFVGLISGTGEEYSVVNRRVTLMGGLVAALFIVPIIIARAMPDTADTIKNFLPYTDSNTWGGLLLSLLITLYGIIFAFPIGILLALGRRSKLPAIHYLCTFIIEGVRGTPFIVVLFAGQFLITFLHPSFQNIPSAYRALASTIIFVAAYLAENVRGGLQAIPGGQYEAGRALGLPEWQITLQITLPQALRAVIPALVGMFISLFKDTSLLEIVSLSDLTHGVGLMVAQPEFREARQEGLIFITLIYFSISYVMALVSRRIEESGAGAARRI